MFVPLPLSALSPTGSPTLLKLVCVLVLCPLAACSLSVDISAHQCEVDEECLAITPDTECQEFICVPVKSEEEARFGCRNEPWKVLNVNVQTTFRIEVISLSDSLPLEGLTVHRCNSLLDQDCLNPAATLVSGADGAVEFDVPEGFNGHFFAPETSSSAPMLLHPFPPPDSESVLSQLNLLNPANYSEIAATAALAGVTVTPGTGILLFTAQDCLGDALSGVQVSSSPRLQDTAVTYISTSGLPDPGLTQTGSIGTGAMVNLPTGFVTVKGVHEELGTIFEQTVLIQADSLTASRILPSQR